MHLDHFWLAGRCLRWTQRLTRPHLSEMSQLLKNDVFTDKQQWNVTKYFYSGTVLCLFPSYFHCIYLITVVTSYFTDYIFRWLWWSADSVYTHDIWISYLDFDTYQHLISDTFTRVWPLSVFYSCGHKYNTFKINLHHHHPHLLLLLSGFLSLPLSDRTFLLLLLSVLMLS